MLQVTNIVRVQNFTDISDKFNPMGICSTENHAQKYITKLYVNL